MTQIGRTSRILVVGDSISFQFPSGTNATSPWLRYYQPAVRSHFAATVSPATARTPQSWPVFFINAVGGRVVGDVSGSFGAIAAALRSPLTHVLIQLGINDAQNLFLGTLDIPTFTGQVNAITTAALAVLADPASLVWCGPWAHDSGDYAVQIAQVDTVLSAKMAAVGGIYVKWSLVSNGGGNALPDGTHPTYPLGATALSVPVLAVT